VTFFLQWRPRLGSFFRLHIGRLRPARLVQRRPTHTPSRAVLLFPWSTQRIELLVATGPRLHRRTPGTASAASAGKDKEKGVLAASIMMPMLRAEFISQFLSKYGRWIHPIICLAKVTGQRHARPVLGNQLQRNRATDFKTGGSSLADTTRGRGLPPARAAHWLTHGVPPSRCGSDQLK